MTILYFWNQNHLHLWELMKWREIFLDALLFCFTENHWVFWVGRDPDPQGSSPNLEWMTQMGIAPTTLVLLAPRSNQRSRSLTDMEIQRRRVLFNGAGKTNTTPQNFIVSWKSCSLIFEWTLKRQSDDIALGSTLDISAELLWSPWRLT